MTAPATLRHKPAAPASRGYGIAYRGADTPCPGCGGSNWIIGRSSAECAFERCGTALPIVPAKAVQ